MVFPPVPGLRDSCQQCGTCCRQGGPALHGADLHLVEAGFLRSDNLVTIRRGELVVHPLHREPVHVGQEFLKIRGQGTDWCCSLLDPVSSTCTIYSHRPHACRVLECWNPEPLLAITGKDLLDRFGVIATNDPILPLVREHENLCPCPPLDSIQSRLRESDTIRADLLQELSDQVNLDLRFRKLAAGRFRLSVAEELFYFGRPLLHLLRPLDIGFSEQNGIIRLEWNRKPTP